MVEHKHYTVTLPNGRHLEVVEAGDRKAPVIILHNGTPSGAGLIREVADDAVSRGLRIVSYGRPGYGDSTRNKGRNVASAAQDTADLADALGIEKFATWGISGGGAHVLACAALLPNRVVAASCLSGLAPFDAVDIDFLGGMGEMNVEEFSAAMSGEEELTKYVLANVDELRNATPEAVAKQLESILSDVDRSAFTDSIGLQIAQEMLDAIHNGVYGWIDDDLAFIKPWGFDPAEIEVPLQIWQGEQDLMVPFAHGKWLSEHIPQAQAHLNAQDGHITMYVNRISEVHAWLAQHSR